SAFASSTSSGCSTRQDTHHEAHTFRSHTVPFKSPGPSVSFGACSLASANAGAGLPSNGEGTSRGSRLRPTQRKATRTTKIASGSDQRSDFTAGPRSIRRRARAGRRADSAGPALDRESIAPVADRDDPAQRHQERAHPDPVDERLQIDANAPSAVEVI